MISAGASAVPALENLNHILGRLGGACRAAPTPVPAVAAAQLGDTGLALHLATPPAWAHLGRDGR